MTLIWATKVQNKWTLLADSGVTSGQLLMDATTTYRPKIREIVWANVTLVVACAWTIRDVDFALNVLENKLEKKKLKSTKELKMFLQDTLADVYRELKSLKEDPEMMFIFLEPKTDTLFVMEWYGITEPKDCAHIVLGSGDLKFYKVLRRNDVFSAFKRAVECDEYCDFPIISYRDWVVQDWYWREDNDSFYSLKTNNECLAQADPCCYPTNSPEWERVYICSWTDKTL